MRLTFPLWNRGSFLVISGISIVIHAFCMQTVIRLIGKIRQWVQQSFLSLREIKAIAVRWFWRVVVSSGKRKQPFCLMSIR